MANSPFSPMQSPPMKKLSCGHSATPTENTTGYASLPNGERICYECADAMQREEMRDRSKPFVAYLSSGGDFITTWTGGRLGSVCRHKPCKLSRRSWIHGKSYGSVWVRDIHGGYWYGRGSNGLAISLRPVKGY